MTCLRKSDQPVNSDNPQQPVAWAVFVMKISSSALIGSAILKPVAQASVIVMRWRLAIRATMAEISSRSSRTLVLIVVRVRIRWQQADAHQPVQQGQRP